MFLDLSQFPDWVRIALEVFGYIGSAVCVASFAMTSVRKLRIVNGIGAVISTIYAVLIGALPIALMNLIIAILDAYQLLKMKKVHEEFEILPASPDSAYFKRFVQLNEAELSTFDESMTFDKAETILYYARDNEVAGILAYDKMDDETLKIRMDYVIPKYRDFQIGNYFFGDKNPYFKKEGVKKFVTETTNPIHEIYLKRINFKHIGADSWCKTIG